MYISIYPLVEAPVLQQYTINHRLLDTIDTTVVVNHWLVFEKLNSAKNVSVRWPNG